MYFISQDGKFGVEISDSIIGKTLDYIKIADRFETGGILIGTYTKDQSTAVVSEITGPTKDSKSGYTWFSRGIKGLKSVLDKYWKANKYYLGEWHFHPQASPTPSSQDITQMKVIAGSHQYHCPEPILMIIGGSWKSYKISVSILTAEGKYYQLNEIASE